MIIFIMMLFLFQKAIQKLKTWPKTRTCLKDV